MIVISNSIPLNKVKKLSLKHWKVSYVTAEGGNYIGDLDRALPGTHPNAVCDYLPRSKATVLAQLYTGKCKLKAYLHRVEAEESDLCDVCDSESLKKFVREDVTST